MWSSSVRVFRLLIILGPCCFAEKGAQTHENEDATREAFRSLLDWMQSGIDEAGDGHRHKPLRATFELHSGQFGNALFSKAHFVKGQLLALLPKSRLIRDETLPYPQSWVSTARLAVHVANARRAGEKSFIQPYVDLLPEHESSRPIHWDPSFLTQHLVGSFFPEYVQWKNAIVEGHYERIKTESTLSLADFKWGWDMVASRAMGGVLMFPVLDLAQHGQPHNVQLRLEGSSLAVRALRPIRPGDEILMDYLNYESKAVATTWDALENWGFIVGDTKKLLKLRAPVHPKLRKTNFTLTNDVDDADGRAFLKYLRIVARESGQGQKQAVAATGIETSALALGEQLIGVAMGRYPQTVEEDDALLEDHSLDARVRFMVMLRRDEKMVLRWWLRMFRRCAQRAQDVDVLGSETCFQDQDSKPSVPLLSQVQQGCIAFFHDAWTAIRHPADFATVVFAIIVLPIALLLDILLLVAMRCSGRHWRGPRGLIFLKYDGSPRSWRSAGAVAAYACLASSCDPGLIWFVAEHQLPFACTLAVISYWTLRRCA